MFLLRKIAAAAVVAAVVAAAAYSVGSRLCCPASATDAHWERSVHHERRGC